MIKLFKKNYAKLMIIPLIFGIIFILLAFIAPGIERGIDLKGGNQIIIHYDDQKDFSNIQPQLEQNFELPEVHISETKSINQYGLLIEFSLQQDIENAKEQRSKLDFTKDIESIRIDAKTILAPLIDKGFLSTPDLIDLENAKNVDNLKLALNEILIISNNNFTSQATNIIKSELNLGDDAKIQIREIAPTLGQDFVKSATKVGIAAFILLIIVILLFFRKIIPSGLIIFAAIFDILAALAGMAIFNISLSLATIPALLMLIGYSVDTDILLSTRLLKDRFGDAKTSANSSIKTGLTMTFTTISTIIVMLVISYLAQILVVFEIAVILLCGLVGDLISTWFFNAPALIKYVEKKNKHRY